VWLVDVGSASTSVQVETRWKESDPVRILAFGVGAIGSLLGHRLAQGGHQVTLVGRSAYVQAVRKRGLLLEEPNPGPHERVAHLDQERRLPPYLRTVHPAAVERIEDLPASQRWWDLILLTVKAYDTREAAQAVAPYASEVPLVIVQNGVGGEELVLQVLNQATITSGAITLSVSVLAPGHVCLETTRGGLNLAPTREGQNIDDCAELFATAGLRTATYHDYRALKWSKLLLNIQANAIPAILDMPPRAVFANPSLFALERLALLEALAVMRALQLRPVHFPGYPVPLLVWAMQTLPAPLLRLVLGRLVASGRGDKKPSLQMDLLSGRQRSEVLYLNGAVVTYAERVGLDVPVNRVLVNTLMDIAARRLPWDRFRGQPQSLIAAVEAGRE
jgi:2-dehydropantoate 2-reductase